MVDDGTGAKEIFRVDHFDLAPVPDEDHGKFYSGDCYVVLYAYDTRGKDQFIIYFWLVSYNSQLIFNRNIVLYLSPCTHSPCIMISILILGPTFKPR